MSADGQDASVNTANITRATNLAIRGSKGRVSLSPGTQVYVLDLKGHDLVVQYRQVEGTVPVADTDYQGPMLTDEKVDGPGAPKVAPSSSSSASHSAPPAAGAPKSTYGKMVQKSRDAAALHKETLVNPADEVSGAKR